MSYDHYRKVENTTVQGSALYSQLTAADVQALNFEQANALQLPIVMRTSTGNEAAASHAISLDELIQASIHPGQLVTNAAGFSGSANNAITLGPDAASQAAQYVSLFNLDTTSDVRCLKFISTRTVGSGSLDIANTSPGGTETRAYVVPQINGTDAVRGQLFRSVTLSSTSGYITNVIVKATSLAAGSERVTFNVLQPIIE